MKQISVLLAVHNGEKYIKDSILSVLNQTYQNFELIICANGCTDKTITIIGSILTEHPLKDKIFLTTLPAASKCEALNYLLKLVPKNREYIAIQDADDIWHPEKLQKQIEILEKKPHIDVVGTYCNYIDENGLIIEMNNSIPSSSEEIIKCILEDKINPFINCSTLINKHLLMLFNGYNKEYEGVEDFYLWAQLAIHTKAKFFNIKEKLVSHRLHKESHFNSSDQSNKIKLIEKYISK